MRLMMLGGGTCQLNLIKRARDEGDEILLADYLPDCPGRALAHRYVPVSTFDVPGVTAAAARYGAQAIVTTGTDQPVYTAAAAARALGLPFYIDPETALAVTNKRVMKALFRKNGIPHCPGRLVGADCTPSELADFSFPAVLKPVDSQGQRGIFLVGGPEEACARLGETLSFSREDRALLEEYYESDEVTVSGWVTEGRPVILTVADRVTIKSDSSVGVSLCHNFPSFHLPRYGEEIRRLTGDLVRALGVRDGPIYFQMLIGEKGLRVNEIAMRIGGAYEDLAIPRLTGVDLPGLLLAYVRHGRCEPADLAALAAWEQAPIIRHLSTQMFFCRPGQAARITPLTEVLRLEGVAAAGYALREGETLGAIENATARAGYVLVEGDSRAQLLRRVEGLFRALQVCTPQGENLVIPYAAYPRKYVMLAPEDGPVS